MFTPCTKLCSRLIVAVAAVGMLTSSVAAQSDTRSPTATTGADLQLSGPANTGGSPAPAAQIDIPTVDDATTKFAPKSQDIDSFIAGDPPAIRDPERQVAVPDVPDTSLEPTAQAGSGSTVMKPVSGSELEKRVARLEALIEAQSTLLLEMSKTQQEMFAGNELKSLREEIAALRKTFQTVARPDPSGNNELASVSPSLSKRGKLVVENLTGVGYTVNINGYDFAIMPGRREFNVPVGPVVTEIRGYEIPKTWTAENFRQVGDENELAIQIK